MVCILPLASRADIRFRHIRLGNGRMDEEPPFSGMAQPTAACHQWGWDSAATINGRQPARGARTRPRDRTLLYVAVQQRVMPPGRPDPRGGLCAPPGPRRSDSTVAPG